jgi:serine/threonine protein kinase
LCCRAGYDGKKVDVWAAGVLLFVMLLGMFPFEMEDENYVNTAGAAAGQQQICQRYEHSFAHFPAA